MRAILTVAMTSHLISELATLPSGTWKQLEPHCDTESDLRDFLEKAEIPEATERLDRLEDFATAIEELEENGISVLITTDERYPQRLLNRLGAKAPPLIFAGGNIELLNSGSIGVVGSREIDEDGTEFAKQIAREAVAKGLSVASGAARGVDQTAMMAAVEAGGSVVGFMADSLKRGLKGGNLREAFEEGRVCLCTPFSPNAGFSVGNAMGRNKLIYAHSQATVVVASAENEGGTWSGAIEALRLDLTPVIVRTSPLPGNQALIRKGGLEIPEPEDIWKVIESFQPLQGNLL